LAAVSQPPHPFQGTFIIVVTDGQLLTSLDRPDGHDGKKALLPSRADGRRRALRDNAFSSRAKAAETCSDLITRQVGQLEWLITETTGNSALDAGGPLVAASPACNGSLNDEGDPSLFKVQILSKKGAERAVRSAGGKNSVHCGSIGSTRGESCCCRSSTATRGSSRREGVSLDAPGRVSSSTLHAEHSGHEGLTRRELHRRPRAQGDLGFVVCACLVSRHGDPLLPRSSTSSARLPRDHDASGGHHYPVVTRSPGQRARVPGMLDHPSETLSEADYPKVSSKLLMTSSTKRRRTWSQA
jgi:hypothetical protein